MTSIFLEPQEVRQIEQYLQSPETLLQKRARIILRYTNGESTRQVAEQVGLSRPRTRFWRRQFELHRIGIFTQNADGISTKAQEAADNVSGSVFIQVIKPNPPPENPSQSFAIKPVSPAFPTPFDRPGVLPDDPIAEAGRKVLLYHFAEMLRHEAGTLAGEDIEALHDMRVATRRMRAAFDVFAFAYKPKTIKNYLKGLRATGRALGRVRDLDVFIEKAGLYLDTLPVVERNGLDPLLESWHAERERFRAEMSTHMHSPAYHAFKISFNEFLQKPGAGVLKAEPGEFPVATQVRHVVPTLVYTRLAAMRAYEVIIPNASIPQLHALRIEFKKLRYTLEYFQEVLGKEGKQVINEIKKMQDHLGDLQDADVACSMLHQFLDEWDRKQVNELLTERLNPEPIVTYLANRHAARHNLATAFPHAWAAFNSTELQRNLALSISIL